MPNDCIGAEWIVGGFLVAETCRIGLNSCNVFAHVVVELAAAYLWTTIHYFLSEPINLVWLEGIRREEVLGDSQKAKCV